MLIDHYKAIEDSSRKMLAAARDADWDGVRGLEEVCARLIAQLRQKSRTEKLTPDMRAEKARIMQRILKTDAQIRSLAEPWLARLERQLQGQRHSA